MVHHRRITCGLGVLFASVAMPGCGAEPQSSGQLMDRLTAAEQITPADRKQNALSKVAVDAAGSDQADLSLRAVDQMDASPLRDRTAEQAADQLNHIGRRRKAQDMVSRIGDPAARDRVNEAFAAAPPPSLGN